MAVPIHIEEWLAELERLGVASGPADAFTTEELSRKLSHTHNWVRSRIREALRQGLVVPTKKMAERMDGTRALVAAYRWVKPMAKPKRGKKR